MLNSNTEIKRLSHLYLFICIILFFFVFMSHASPQTHGFFIKLPNRFWPNTTSPHVKGGELEKITAANNPDVFCESQGSGYRLPSPGEFNGMHFSVFPMSSVQPVSPNHWSHYKNNDINSTIKPNTPIERREVNGSLVNEWGTMPNYGNGWDSYYWTTHPGYVQNYTVNEIGRFYTSLALNANSLPIDYQLGKYVRSVACVRDLIPTPSTPVPGKS